jgi:nitronate monooxygenase
VTSAGAERAARAGVDVVVAQGMEAGGHIAGEVTTMVLVPRVVDAVAPLPVAAAGGIADARGLVAALALGAQAVMIGTRLIATPEAYAHPVYKQKVLDAGETETVRTTLETKIGGQSVPLLRFMGFPPTPDATGDLESMDYLAGQSVGLVKEMKPAADVVRELVEDATHILSSLVTASRM